MSKKFDIEELKKYNGLNEKPAFVAFKGKVYDVSRIFKNGEHAGIKAGTDLTETFRTGPHDEKVFDNFPVVGSMKNKSGLGNKIFGGSTQQADLLLRLALGIVFLAHGSQKLFGWFGGFGWEGTMGFFTQVLHIPGPLAGLAILAEFFGGVAIVLGILTRPAALMLFATMIVAAMKVHLANGFFLDSQGPADGIEYVYVLIMLSLYFLIKGAGTISGDRVIAEKIGGKK